MPVTIRVDGVKLYDAGARAVIAAIRHGMRPCRRGASRSPSLDEERDGVAAPFCAARPMQAMVAASRSCA